MTLFSLSSLLFTTVLMGLLSAGKTGQAAAQVDADLPRPRMLPRRWSSFLIAMTVVYFFLLLAGLCYAGWFRMA